MAILDARLFSMIETLVAAGLDWLAFELIEGVRRGQEIEETNDILAISRERARRQAVSESKSEPQAYSPLPKLLLAGC
jgi:hypothetical protein